MAGFRLTDADPVYLGTDGITPCAGGTLNFYDTGTTTPRNIYGEAALTTNNGAVLTLDSTGRAAVDVWLSGIYRVILKNASATTIWTRDNVQVQGDTFPTLVTGKFLTNNGTVTSWSAIRQIPDPTGSSGKFLTTDGTTDSWSTVTDSQQGLMKQQTVTAATTTTIDLTLGQSIILNQAVDITSLVFTNPPTTTATYFVTIKRVKDATGTARVISNLTSLAFWLGGNSTLTQTTGAIDELHFKFVAGVTKADATLGAAFS